MAETSDGDQFHFDPATYLDMIRGEVPAYDEFQDAVAAATVGIHVERVLELGVGTGATAPGYTFVTPQAGDMKRSVDHCWALLGLLGNGAVSWSARILASHCS
jgi:hypothetical protein